MKKSLDDVLNQGRERFLLHYNFPPFSTGEAKPVRGVGRREIGHGNLAHRALKRMFPDGFPLCMPHRKRHPGKQRVIVNGDSMRRRWPSLMPASNETPRQRHRHGPYH